MAKENKEEVKNLSKGQKRRLEKKTKIQRKKQFDQYLNEVKDTKKNANNMNLSQMEKDLDTIATQETSKRGNGKQMSQKKKNALK